MTKKKKIIVLSCMIALLSVTAVFNFMLTTNENVQGTVNNSAVDYFEQYRQDRLTTRNEELLELDSIIATSNISTTELNDAISLKSDITKMSEKEFLLENLIKAYGFSDVVVIMSLDTDNINVVTKTESLSTDDAILIYSIIDEECSVSPENVKIIPIC